MTTQTPPYDPLSIEGLPKQEFTSVDNWLDSLADRTHCILSSLAYQSLILEGVYASIVPSTRNQLLTYGYLGELKYSWGSMSLNVELFTDAYLDPNSPKRIFSKQIRKEGYTIVDGSYIVIPSDRQTTLNFKN